MGMIRGIREVLYNYSEGVVIFMRRVYERLDALGG